MKRLLITSLLVLYIILPKDGFGKNSVKIEISDLLITKSSQSSFIKLGFSKGEVLKSFGKPLEAKKAYFTKFDFRGEVLKYNGAEFYFMDGKLEAFEITNNLFVIKIKGKDNYAIVGNSLKNFGGLNNIVLQKNGENWDELLSFILNPGNRVTSIICGPD